MLVVLAHHLPKLSRKRRAKFGCSKLQARDQKRAEGNRAKLPKYSEIRDRPYCLFWKGDQILQTNECALAARQTSTDDYYMYIHIKIWIIITSEVQSSIGNVLTAYHAHMTKH